MNGTSSLCSVNDIYILGKLCYVKGTDRELEM